MTTNYRIRKSNRIRSKSADKKGKFWCEKCDANLIGIIGKCSNCGFINSLRKCKNFEIKD